MVVVVEAGQLAYGCHEPGAGRERLGAEEGARSLAHDTPIFNAHRFVELPRRNLVLHALQMAVSVLLVSFVHRPVAKDACPGDEPPSWSRPRRSIHRSTQAASIRAP